jgi:hypothetical protein
LEEKHLIELFNTFLTQIVEHNTKHKIKLDDIGVRCDEGQKEFKKLKEKCAECNFKKVEDFIDAYKKRNYTDQEVSDLGAHVYQVNEMYKFHKWFKGKSAILLGAVALLVAIFTLSEKLIKVLEFINNIGVTP